MPFPQELWKQHDTKDETGARAGLTVTSLEQN